MELKHAILGMLSITPLSGYDLNRAFVGSVAHFWHADQSQIYRTLDRLAADGAIKTKVIRQSGKPDRKVHSLTPAGRGELHRWLTSPLEEEKIKEPFAQERREQEVKRRLLEINALIENAPRGEALAAHTTFERREEKDVKEEKKDERKEAAQRYAEDYEEVAMAR